MKGKATLFLHQEKERCPSCFIYLFFYLVNLTQTRVIWEVGTSVEEILRAHRQVCKGISLIYDWCERCHPGTRSLGCRRKQTERSVMSKLVSSVPLLSSVLSPGSGPESPPLTFPSEGVWPEGGVNPFLSELLLVMVFSTTEGWLSLSCADFRDDMRLVRVLYCGALDPAWDLCFYTDRNISPHPFHSFRPPHFPSDSTLWV